MPLSLICPAADDAEEEEEGQQQAADAGHQTDDEDDGPDDVIQTYTGPVSPICEAMHAVPGAADHHGQGPRQGTQRPVDSSLLCIMKCCYITLTQVATS